MNEIGIRVALGASRSHLFWMVLREGLLLASMGLALGIPVALGTGQLVSGMLFGIEAANPMNIVASAVLLALLATLAGYLPARRAMRVDPMVALRYE
jgi:ABC-type antimicrobial peptide transport system permease subunit